MLCQKILSFRRSCADNNIFDVAKFFQNLLTIDVTIFVGTLQMMRDPMTQTKKYMALLKKGMRQNTSAESVLGIVKWIFLTKLEVCRSKLKPNTDVGLNYGGITPLNINL